ncbi:signal peptidase II [Motiliproteus sp. SC1-56]|uniref:signal peptidase II n=1 Tax=Motiliproteus sp. SC1-56 TaxID=2799565 RepID=UPI001A8D721C|nr:signal peptidase II [Motiliproteus sp. SC1-56]
MVVNRRRGGLAWLWLSALVIVLDQASKYLATQALEYASPVALLPVFDLTLLHNTGAAFSFLASAGGWQRWFFAAVAVAVSAYLVHWLHKTGPQQRWQGIALALILGGALGNLIDRIWLGYVIDFISLHWKQYYYPAFNLADSAITVGALMLLWEMLFMKAGEPTCDTKE